MKNKKSFLSSCWHVVCCLLWSSGSCLAPEEARAGPFCSASKRSRKPLSPEELCVLRCGNNELADEMDKRTELETSNCSPNMVPTSYVWLFKFK